MTFSLAPLVGYNSLRAFQVFNTLHLGLKMLPAYQLYDYPSFFALFKDKSDSEKEDMVREALAFVELSQDEVKTVISFASDANGIPYGASNMGNLSPDVLFEIIVAVMVEIGKIKITLVTEEEKKKSPSSQST